MFIYPSNCHFVIYQSSCILTNTVIIIIYHHPCHHLPPNCRHTPSAVVLHTFRHQLLSSIYHLPYILLSGQFCTSIWPVISQVMDGRGYQTTSTMPSVLRVVFINYTICHSLAHLNHPSSLEKVYPRDFFFPRLFL